MKKENDTKFKEEWLKLKNYLDKKWKKSKLNLSLERY